MDPQEETRSPTVPDQGAAARAPAAAVVASEHGRAQEAWRADFLGAVEEAADVCGYDTRVACDAEGCGVMTRKDPWIHIRGMMRRPGRLLERLVIHGLDLPDDLDACHRALSTMETRGQRSGWGVDSANICMGYEPVSEPRVDVLESVLPPICAAMMAPHP